MAEAVPGPRVRAAAGASAADPSSLLGGRVHVGGEVSGTLAPEDEGNLHRPRF